MKSTFQINLPTCSFLFLLKFPTKCTSIVPPASDTRYLCPEEKISMLLDPMSNSSTGYTLQKIDAASGSKTITNLFVSIPALKEK